MLHEGNNLQADEFVIIVNPEIMHHLGRALRTGLKPCPLEIRFRTYQERTIEKLHFHLESTYARRARLIAVLEF